MQRGSDPSKDNQNHLDKIFAMYEGNAVTLSTTGEYGLGEKQPDEDESD